MTGAEQTRTVILHIDDVGMCHGANAAYLELSALGTCTSGSVMVPAPWFHEIAEAVGDHGEFDLGVHLTLNAEMPHYKWRPLTRPPASAGLTDSYGYFWPDVASVQRHGAAEAVEAELRAQIDAALAAGIDVTHLDAHMGAVLTAEFCDIYVRLGTEYRLPVVMTASIADFGPNHNFEDFADGVYRRYAKQARDLGFTIFDAVPETPWVHRDDIAPVYKQMIAAAPVGTSCFSLHGTAPGEIEAIEPDNHAIRTKEYELFRDPAFGAWLGAQEMSLTGFRPLRDTLRAVMSSPPMGRSPRRQHHG